MSFNSKIIANHIVDWLLSYIEDIPVKGFIVGVSGGVDSAVVASLCARTGKNTVLLNLPIHQSESEYKRAQDQIDFLVGRFPNVTGMKIDLSSSFEEFKVQMPSRVKEDHLSMANARARLRMTTLYAVGQTNSLLVTGTGNKIEDYGIGFFTKYGDGGVDINPIGDLLKSEVYLLAKELEVIKSIQDAAPTDGLWGDDRNDEDQIGATYEELEFAMQFEGDENNLTERQKEVLAIYRRMHSMNQHKMIPIPVCDISALR